MAGKLNKSEIFFADGVENADGAQIPAGESDDGASRAAELALKRLHLFSRQPIILLEKPF